MTNPAPQSLMMRGDWSKIVPLVLLGALAAGLETRSSTIIGGIAPIMDFTLIVIGAVALRAAFASSDLGWRLPWRRPSTVIVLAFLCCLAAGWLGGVSWPNSGDEYSYVFLADTLRSGRLWVPAPPDPYLFFAAHVSVKDGMMFSPYPPGWSALLAPFRALGVGWLTNPLLTVLLGVALAGCARRLKLSPAIQTSALSLVLLTPFTAFLGGSLFPQTISAAVVACIVWVQLTDEARPGIAKKLLIGALFGALMLIRYDVCLIVAVVYAADRLACRRTRVFGDGLWVVLGALPFVGCLLAYDAAITGNPLQLTAYWDSPEILGSAIQGLPTSLGWRILALNLYWLGGLAQFGGLPVLVLSVIGLAVKIRRRTCRFYDFMLPAAVLFYSFLPFTGGHQYGPRYWFWAWPLAMLTITTALADEAGQLRAFGRHFSFEGLAAASLVYATAAFCVLLVTTHVYIQARRSVFDVPPPQVRSVILIPRRLLVLWPWQYAYIHAMSYDFTRNDLDFAAPVLYGSADVPNSEARACRLGGRAVFLWEPPGRLRPVACP